MKNELNKPSIIKSLMAAGVMTFIFVMTSFFVEPWSHWWYWLSAFTMFTTWVIPAYLIAIKLPGFKQIHAHLMAKKEAKFNFKVKKKQDKMEDKLSKEQAEREIKEAQKLYNKQRKQIIKMYKNELMELSTPEEQDKVIDELIKDHFGQ